MTRIARFHRTLLAITPGAATLAGSYAVADPSEAATAPSFVQQVSAHEHAASLAVTPEAPVTAGDRPLVKVGILSSGKATAASVKSSHGYGSSVDLTIAGGIERVSAARERGQK
jgi:hypothetical protein